jgi:hypothetical protein
LKADSGDPAAYRGTWNIYHLIALLRRSHSAKSST